MKRYVIVGMFAAVLFGTVSALSADGKLYHLSKVPKFRVGDRAIATETELFDGLITTSDGKMIISKEKTRENARIIYEVTKVDKSGKIQAFRVSIISAKAKFDVLAPEKSSKKIAIEKIHFIARRKGIYFDADLTTVVGEKDKTLKASQIWLLKQQCKDEISFPMYEEADALLIPTEPVPVGHKWKPTRKTLDKWTEAGSVAKDLKGKVISAGFQFVSVTDGIALVEGNIIVEVTFAGKRQKISGKVTERIDTKSGRWVGSVFSGPIVLKMQGVVAKMDARHENTATFKPGKGKVSALPEKIFKIGWKRPGKDTNNHIDKAEGFSLNVPKSYTAQKPPPDSPFIAQFVNKRGFIIGVTCENADRPMDIDEVMRVTQAVVRKDLKDYEITGREKLSLPDNVPAVLLTGKGYDGKVAILTIMAFDGKRVLSVSTSAPIDMKDLLAELKKTLKSLRLFESDYTKAPPEASDKP